SPTSSTSPRASYPKNGSRPPPRSTGTPGRSSPSRAGYKPSFPKLLGNGRAPHHPERRKYHVQAGEGRRDEGGSARDRQGRGGRGTQHRPFQRGRHFPRHRQRLHPRRRTIRGGGVVR